ncbi:MAG: hypothetical protein VB018_05920 [Lachnospiraceae bacterium]|nr:hypothetical protein [Lachnospiraceae bacterium]
MIEMPFENDIYIELKKELLDKYYINCAKENYYDRIINSDKFEQNIKYIQGYKNIQDCLIREKYQELISKVLELLGDIKYKEHNKKILEWCQQHKNSHRGKDELTENNKYITLSL